MTDRSRIDAWTAGRPSRRFRRDCPGTGPSDDPRTLLEALKRGFGRVEQEAEHNGPDEAASELTTVYMTEFEPLERYLLGRSPRRSGRWRSSSTRCAAI